MAKLKTSKIHKKFQNQKFQNLKKTFLGNVKRHVMMKFQGNWSNGVGVNGRDGRRTDGRTDDGRTTDDGRISI
jgi:hypothetical protein